HRHGHQRELAFRATARGPGRHAIPLAVPRPHRGTRRQEVSRGIAGSAGALGRREDRAQDAAEPAQERQGIPERLPVPRRPLVIDPGLPGRSRKDVDAMRSTALLLVVALAVGPSGADGEDAKPTDYQAELRQIDEAMAALRGDRPPARDDPAQDPRAAYL